MDTQIILVIGSALFIFIVSIFLFGFIVKYQNKSISFKAEKKIMESRFQQTLLETRLEIQEETLRTISQEIHDNIGQALSLAKLNLGTMDIGRPDLLLQKIEDSRSLVAKAIRDLRDLSKSLNSDYVSEMGLLRSVEYTVELVRKTGSFVVGLNVEGNPYRLDSQKELILFRIIQEAINNIIKHADASNVSIDIDYQLNTLVITITDDGKGFETGFLNITKNINFGLGIRNMHDRAKMVGADFSISSILQKGTTIMMSLPIIPQNQ